MNKQSISPQKTFDNFIVSRSNEKAYSACIDLVDNPKGKLVVLYGANSLGKSHLLYAVKNALIKKDPDLPVRFTNYEDLISQYITALNKSELNVFVDNLLETDLLIMDNMQFVAGKCYTQEEIANWINKMLTAGKAVVVAFDRPIKHYTALINGISESNPENYKVVEIKKPDYLLRKKYLNHLLNEYPATIPFVVRKYLVHSQRMPFTAMKGFIHKCNLLEKQKSKTLSISEIRKCLSSYVHKEVQ